MAVSRDTASSTINAAFHPADNIPVYREWKRAQRRPALADFHAFDLVAAIWWEFRHRRKGHPPDDVLQSIMTWLGNALVEAIGKGDAASFRLIASAVEQIAADPHRKAWLTPDEPWDFWLTTYYMDRDSATIGELITFCCERMNLLLDADSRPKYALHIHRHCDKLGLRISPSKPGPKRGSKRSRHQIRRVK
jgi:hypothetical protein